MQIWFIKNSHFSNIEFLVVYDPGIYISSPLLDHYIPTRFSLSLSPSNKIKTRIFRYPDRRLSSSLDLYSRQEQLQHHITRRPVENYARFYYYSENKPPSFFFFFSFFFKL
jgi:hypothetical protein